VQLGQGRLAASVQRFRRFLDWVARPKGDATCAKICSVDVTRHPHIARLTPASAQGLLHDPVVLAILRAITNNSGCTVNV
jgi:hypothetical protein